MARRRTSRARRSSAAFTLIEVLVSLAILAVVVSAVSLVHLQTLKAARHVATIQAGLGPLEQVVTCGAAGVAPQLVTDDLRQQGWMAERDMLGGGGEALWEVWRVSPSGMPWSVVSVYLTPVGPGQAGR